MKKREKKGRNLKDNDWRPWGCGQFTFERMIERHEEEKKRMEVGLWYAVFFRIVQTRKNLILKNVRTFILTYGFLI